MLCMTLNIAMIVKAMLAPGLLVAWCYQGVRSHSNASSSTSHLHANTVQGSSCLFGVSSTSIPVLIHDSGVARIDHSNHNVIAYPFEDQLLSQCR